MEFNVSTKGPQNCRSLGFARDDKERVTVPSKVVAGPRRFSSAWMCDRSVVERSAIFLYCLDSCNRSQMKNPLSPLSSRAADSRFASRERNDKACALCNIEGPNRRVPQVSLLRPGIPQTNSHWKHPPCSLSLGAKPRDLQFLSRFTATLYYAPAARLQSDWQRLTC
jgi:hypothetical protein